MGDLNFLTGETTQKGYAIIDMSQIALSTAQHTLNPNEKITLGLLRHIILSSIKHNVLKFKKDGYTNIIIAIDNALPMYWRREFAYYYKKNRAKAREESTFDWEGFFTSLRIIVDEFKVNMPYVISDIPKAEADDTIGVLTKKLSDEGHKVLIISSDGDFTQLQKYKNVKQYSPMQKKWVEPKYGSPEHDLMTKIVKGDKKDCVASIKVRSDYWFTHVEGERTPITKTSFIDDMVNAKNPFDLLSDTEKLRFKENEVLIDLSKVREDIVAQILDNYNNYKLPGRNKIYKYFVKSGLSKLTKEVNNF